MFKKAIIVLTVLSCLMLSIDAFAAKIESGVWRQTSSNAGDCPNCIITVKQVYDDIIQIEAARESDATIKWVGFYVYHKDTDEYKGFERWFYQSGPWKDAIGESILVFEGTTLSKRADYGKNGVLKGTYRKK